MRILLGHTNYEHPTNIKDRYGSWLARLRASGIAVDGFCLTLDPKKPNFIWPEMDQLWRNGDKELLGMYERLARRLEDYDVFVNYNGINLHPDFVRQLPTFNVYSCFDDPEASDILSRPVAWAYDLAMVGNIAEVETYRSWGVKEARFWPMGFRADDYQPSLTREQILNGKRDIDIALACERQTSYRRERLDKFVAAFPQGAYYGKGWPNGHLLEDQCVLLYQRTKVGINIHNSTGPINFRTYILPADGVMQVCDNKSHLGQIYELDKEVVGFDTIEEAIDLCHYYLAHDEERRQIAAAGWERTLRDYNEVATFRRLVSSVEQLQKPVPQTTRRPLVHLRRQRRKGALIRVWKGMSPIADRVKYAARYFRCATQRRWHLIKGNFAK